MDAISTDLTTALTGWSSALASDSVSPQPSYAINGKQVSRDEWRANLLRMIGEAQAVINARNPFFIITRGVVGYGP